MKKLYDLNAKCKHCKKAFMHHLSGDNRCVLVDYEGMPVSGRYGNTFFEPEESELDKLVKRLERMSEVSKALEGVPVYIHNKNINAKKLLEELRELRK